MEFEKNKINQIEVDSDNNLDLRELVEKYLRHWKWFLFAIITSLLFCYLYLNFVSPQYQSISIIKIKNEKGGDRTALSAFQDLGMMAPANQVVEDEIEILKSKDLISEVVKSLNLNIQFFTNKNKISEFLDSNLSFNTNHYENERYLDPPLEINFLINDSLLYKTNAEFIISINSLNNFTFTELFKGKQLDYKKYSFGEKVSTLFGNIVITPNPDFDQKELIGSSVLVNISAVRSLANNYAKGIKIEPKSQFSNILSLSITDGVKRKGEDFLTELVNKYNERAIRLKEELTMSTSNFVTKRLEIISNELSDVDLDAQSIKTRYRLSDVASNTGLNMQSGQAIENQIVQASAELEKIGYIKEFVSTKDDDELIPVDVGVTDNSLSSTMGQYNQLMMQKKRLLENSTEKNPIVANLNEQLKTLRDNIDQGLNNLESSQKISLDALNRQDLRINSRLYSAPKQERQYRDVQRQQQIKEALYLYLLQKREETAITLGVADPNAKIIDRSDSLPAPISPNKILIYLGFLILALLIPSSIIYFSEILDSKIHTREEVEKILNIPIIGDIPKLESKSYYLLKKEDYSSVAEAFRILRTNLNFVLPNSSVDKGKLVFVTSTIAHEGKSLISSNLSVSLAHAGKRTLIIGMDIRAPKFKDYLGVENSIGVTNYIINSDITPQDLVIRHPQVENLDVIISGDLAPNPSELLMNQRVKKLFDFARNNYEYVLVDTAAFSMVTDTLLLSSFADAFIYVIRANFLDKRLLKYIKFIYNEKRLPNMSLLINGVDHKKSYGYGYGYGYGTKFEKTKKLAWWKFNT